MPETSVTTNLNETLDVKVDLFSKLTLDAVLSVNKLSKAINLILSKVVHLNVRVDASLGQNLLA